MIIKSLTPDPLGQGRFSVIVHPTISDICPSSQTQIPEKLALARGVWFRVYQTYRLLLLCFPFWNRSLSCTAFSLQCLAWEYRSCSDKLIVVSGINVKEKEYGGVKAVVMVVWLTWVTISLRLGAKTFGAKQTFGGLSFADMIQHRLCQSLLQIQCHLRTVRGEALSPLPKSYACTASNGMGMSTVLTRCYGLQH